MRIQHNSERERSLEHKIQEAEEALAAHRDQLSAVQEILTSLKAEEAQLLASMGQA